MFKFIHYTVNSVSFSQDSLQIEFQTDWFQTWDGTSGSASETLNIGSVNDLFPKHSVSGHIITSEGRPNRIRQGIFPELVSGTSGTGFIQLFEDLKGACDGYSVSSSWEYNVFVSSNCGEFYSIADDCYGDEVWIEGVPFSIYSRGCVAGFIERIPVFVSTQNCQFGKLQYLGMSEIEAKQLIVLPNPTEGQVNFQSLKKGILSVLDLSGRTVLTSVAVKGQNTVDVRSLPNGVYLLQLQTENLVSSARFVKN